MELTGGQERSGRGKPGGFCGIALSLFGLVLVATRNIGHPCTLIMLLQPEDRSMDWNRVEGNWKEVKGKVKEKWGKLTDDDLTAINGQRDQLEGRLQQRYGFAKDQARQDVDTWFSSLK